MLPRPALAILLLCIVTSTAFSQYGVAPSQTGMFFDDLRNKAGDRNKKDQVQQGEGVYDYSDQGGFQGGQANNVMHDAASQIAQGYNSVGNLVYSARQAGDYTQYSGPYAASTTFFAPAYTSDPFLGGRRNLKVGPVNVGFGLTTLVEYNDNVTRSGATPVSDVIGSAYLNISANYQITEKSALSLSTAIGFDHYFEHPELSPYGNDFVVNVLPGSTISLDAMIGPVYVVVYDRMAVRPAAQNDFTLNNRSIFGVFQNDAGLGATWSVNAHTSLSMNYTHSTSASLNSNGTTTDSLGIPIDDSRYDRTVDSLQGSLAWSPTGVWTTGIEGGTSLVNYASNFNNDGTTTNIGAFFSTPLGKSTSMRISGGFQDLSFDAPKTTIGTSGDSSSNSDYYYNVTFSNRLSSRVSQALNFGHESALNTISNYISADYVSYGVGIIAWSGSRLMLSGYYENAQDSGGLEAESVEQWGFDAYLSHQLTSRVRLGVGYHYGTSTSDMANRGYVQQAFNCDISYALSRKLFITAGYRFLTTNADASDLSFDQNRMIISANYNF